MKFEDSEVRLRGAETFLFTGNYIIEAAYYNGKLLRKTMFELVVKWRKLELMEGVDIHLIGVCVTRRIDQGINGISRLHLLKGVMVGINMLYFVKIGLTACEHSPEILSWIQSWAVIKYLPSLTPVEWFWKVQGLYNNTIKISTALAFLWLEAITCFCGLFCPEYQVFILKC